jgi:serine/threonine-protein kinase
MKLERTAPSLAQATGEQWPSGVERFLERSLERDRERRFDSAAQALDVWRSIQFASIRTSTPPGAPDGPSDASAPPEAPPPREPMQSYPVVDDVPTDVDGPPTMMTIDGSEPILAPETTNKPRKTGRQ